MTIWPKRARLRRTRQHFLFWHAPLEDTTGVIIHIFALDLLPPTFALLAWLGGVESPLTRLGLQARLGGAKSIKIYVVSTHN